MKNAKFLIVLAALNAVVLGLFWDVPAEFIPAPLYAIFVVSNILAILSSVGAGTFQNS